MGRDSPAGCCEWRRLYVPSRLSAFFLLLLMGFYIEDQVRKELLILMHKKGRKGNVYRPSILYETGSWQWILNFSSSTKLSLDSYLWRHHQKIERTFYQFMSEVKVKLFFCKPRRHTEQVEVWHHFILILALRRRWASRHGYLSTGKKFCICWWVGQMGHRGIYQFSTTQNTTAGKITLKCLGNIVPLYPYHQSILWLSDQYNKTNVLIFWRIKTN